MQTVAHKNAITDNTIISSLRVLAQRIFDIEYVLLCYKWMKEGNPTENRTKTAINYGQTRVLNKADRLIINSSTILPLMDYLRSTLQSMRSIVNEIQPAQEKQAA